MGDGSNDKSNSEKEGSDPEKLTLKRVRARNIDGHAVCDTLSSDRSLPALNGQVIAGSDTEEGEMIRSPDAYAESEQQSGDGLPPSTKERVVDHEAVSDHNLGQRKRVAETSCRICERNFPSLNSLYGHMRNHKRDWKGVSPPPEKKTQVPITAPDFNDCSTVLPTKSWAVSAKRGRKKNAAAYRKYEEESDDAVIDAANTLMLLANGCFSLNSTLVRQQQCRNPVQHDSRVMNNKDDQKITTPTQMDNVDKTEGSNQNNNRLMIGCKPTEKIHNLETATDLAADRKQYSCSTCNKSFSSPQALGGHTASHNKSKSNAGAGISVGVEGAKLAQAEGLIGQGRGLPTKVSEHRCKTCSLVFPTGQALGGHMRKHWLGPENAAAGKNFVAPSAQNGPENVVAPSAGKNFVAPSAQNGPENVVAPSAGKNFVAPSAQNGPENVVAPSAWKNFVAPSAQNGPENVVAPSARKNFVAPSAQNGPENVVASSAGKNFVAPSAQNGPENVVAHSAENGPENFVAPSAQNGPENVVAPSAENRPENFVAPSAENGPENFVAPSAENGRENVVAPRKENHFRFDFDLNEPALPEDSE